jgi:hypothetical protein
MPDHDSNIKEDGSYNVDLLISHTKEVLFDLSMGKKVSNGDQVCDSETEIILNEVFSQENCTRTMDEHAIDAVCGNAWEDQPMDVFTPSQHLILTT